MANHKILEDSIKNFAEIKAAELSKGRNYNPKEFEVFIKTRLYAALNELIKIKSSDLKISPNSFLDTYISAKPAIRKKEFRIRLPRNTLGLKDQYQLKKSFGDYKADRQTQLLTASKKKNNRQPHTENPVLTKRELEVAELIAQELSYKMISARLKISIRTVHTHARNIHNKLGKHNVAGVINHVIENREKNKPT